MNSSIRRRIRDASWYCDVYRWRTFSVDSLISIGWRSDSQIQLNCWSDRMEGIVIDRKSFSPSWFLGFSTSSLKSMHWSGNFSPNRDCFCSDLLPCSAMICDSPNDSASQTAQSNLFMHYPLLMQTDSISGRHRSRSGIEFDIAWTDDVSKSFAIMLMCLLMGMGPIPENVA
jgi:hypothetical protein